MQSYSKFIFVFICMAGSGDLLAQSASLELSKIEADTLVLKAREKQLDVQAKIISKQSEIASKQAETDRLTQSAVVGNPVVLSIEGIGKKMFATLKMDGDTTVDIQSGDVLSNGMKIVSIRTNEVIIEDFKSKRTRLAMATHLQYSSDPVYPNRINNLPPLMPPLAPPAAMPPTALR